VRVAVKAIAPHLPERVVTNDDLGAQNPSWDMDLVGRKTGVLSRRIARDDETALDLGLSACHALFDKAPEARDAIDAILFCTQEGDYVMPPNACLLHNELGLPDGVFASDFNLACSGFTYGLALAQGLIYAGTATNVLLVTAHTYSKYIHPKDRSAMVLFGDGAAATWIAASDGDEGLLDFDCGTSGKGWNQFWVPAGGARTPRSEKTREQPNAEDGDFRTAEHIHMDGMGVLAFVNSKVPPSVNRVLTRNSLAVDDIKLFVFHQASALALDTLERRLKIPSEKLVRTLEHSGNLVSASIPVALDEAQSRGDLESGDLVLLSGFGVGLSWATALVRI
jgi:3-oxoacyl-[acyl-carrier-protein] synthase III